MKHKSIEQRLRRDLRKHGYQLLKSRARSWSFDNQLGYMIVDPFYNTVVAGPRYDLTLEDVSEFAAIS